MSKNGRSPSRPLEIFGIGEEEEKLYRWLLVHSNSSLGEITKALKWSNEKSQRLLDIVEEKGLATHSPQRPRRYLPVAPDLAMASLANQNREAVERALALVPEMLQKSKGQSNDNAQVVELITNRETIRQTFELMHQTAKSEILGLVRRPLHVSRIDVPVEKEEHSQREAQARGVLYKTIVDVDYLKLRGALGGSRGEIKVKEKIRIVKSLPFKMILADRKLGLVPLYIERRDSPLLLVRASSLLDGLYSLFEMYWERAAPISLTESGPEYDLSDSHLDGKSQELLSMMVAGFNDKSIAYELGVTTRTLQRHVARLMSSLNARTRFQLGWFAASKLSKNKLSKK